MMEYALYGLAAVLAITALIFGPRAYIWLGEKIGAEQRDKVADALWKLGIFAVTQIYPLVQKYGWNSEEVRIAVKARVKDEFEYKFPDAAKAAAKIGVDVATTKGRGLIDDQIDRMLPDIISKVSDSPASPPKELTKELLEGQGDPRKILENLGVKI